MKNETILNISKRVGYSITTVSRVLSGQAEKYRISEKTAQIIVDEAKKCNYKPSFLAQGLRTKRTNTIGLIIPSIDNQYFASFANVIVNEVKKHGYKILIVDSGENESCEKEELEVLISRQVDGVIVVPCGQNSEYLEQICVKTPIILIDRYFKDSKLSYVSTDNYIGSLKAIQYLINCGHKNIACIQGSKHSIPVQERVRGYKDGMKEANLEEFINICGEDFSIQNGYIETKLQLAKSKRPTAIFAQSNTILLGALKAIRESGLQIPSDISIISYDNNIHLEYMNPAITCINQPIEEIGVLAVKFILNKIKDPQTQQEVLNMLMPPNLIIRDSVLSIHRQNHE